MATRGVVPFGEQSWEQEADGVRALVCQVDGARWAIVEYAPGSGRPEFCEVGHEGYVISGEIEYEFESGGKIVAKAGEGFVLPDRRPAPRLQSRDGAGPAARDRRAVSRLRVAVDVGGTFTDICVLDEDSGAIDGRQGALDAADPIDARDRRRRRRPASTCATSRSSRTARRSRRTR